METLNKKPNNLKINHTIIFLSFLALSMGQVLAQTKTFSVNSFNKIIVSPHIQVDFIQADKESVVINDISVSIEKLNVEVSGKNLEIYLDDAKMTTKNETEKNNDHKVKHPIYNGTIVKATIYYKNLNELSLRGEEKFICKSLLNSEKFKLRIYGEAEVLLTEVKLNTLSTIIYGESILEIKKGNIGNQKITAYGESEINALGAETQSAKITLYGESDINLNVSKNLKITSYGEANIKYTGNPKINKGIVIGDTTIEKI